MNKKQREEMKKKIASVEETVKILKIQETNLLETLRLHPYDQYEKEVNTWVREIIIGCDYIVRLENSINIMKEALKTRRKRGGKEDE